MAIFELKLPKMGESVAEATITTWHKNVGDTVAQDETIVEIATDKVDSDVACEVSGKLIEIRVKANNIAQVGQVIALIETSGNTNAAAHTISEIVENTPAKPIEIAPSVEVEKQIDIIKESVAPILSNGDKFYSPLVKNIAKAEGITQAELDQILGSGQSGRVTKNDVLDYINSRTTGIKNEIPATEINSKVESQPIHIEQPKISVPEPNVEKAISPKVIYNTTDEVIEMSRMGKLIAKHMIDSVQTSAHVQSFIEADVTNIWNWRNKIKDKFLAREGENLTFTPIFLEIVAKALRDFPLMNISVQGDSIIKKRNINIGMAAALPDGNLIVPVIKNADQLNLIGLTKQVNDLAKRARANKLKPDEIQDGTYTVTNVGSFGSLTGTPIINQPQVGILALGAIRKMPAVIETEAGDFIGIRFKMILSHSYDHRVVNGALGGEFVKAVKDYIEAWDMHREI